MILNWFNLKFFSLKKSKKNKNEIQLNLIPEYETDSEWRILQTQTQLAQT